MDTAGLDKTVFAGTFLTIAQQETFFNS